MDELAKKLEQIDLNEVNLVDNLDLCVSIFSFLYPQPFVKTLIPNDVLLAEYQQDKRMRGYRKAYSSLYGALSRNTEQEDSSGTCSSSS